jgi:hypothetical protein
MQIGARTPAVLVGPTTALLVGHPPEAPRLIDIYDADIPPHPPLDSPGRLWPEPETERSLSASTGLSGSVHREV